MRGTNLVTVTDRTLPPPPTSDNSNQKKSQKKVTKLSLSPLFTANKMILRPRSPKTFLHQGKNSSFDTRVSKYHKKCLEDFQLCVHRSARLVLISHKSFYFFWYTLFKFGTKLTKHCMCNQFKWQLTCVLKILLLGR